MPHGRATGGLTWAIPRFLVLTLLLSGCALLQPVSDVEDEFGHRIEGVSVDGRQTIAISPPDEGTTYRFFDASYESVTIRPGVVTTENEAEGVPVEVLIKGAFPDSCSELHEVEQQRAGNLYLVTLTMRRPEGAICASVLRPYRYYLDLDGTSKPGSYSMKLNEKSHSFVVRAAPTNDS